jgi:hypothetical protein
MPIFNLFKHSLRLASLAAATMCAGYASIALAQDNAALTRPDTAVPLVNYRSVFKETSLGVEKDTDNWRKANNEVGKFTRGHVDILKWEEQEAAKAMTERDAIKKPATTQPNGTIAPKPDASKPVAAPVHKH